jgi:predicted dehydrogenase
MQPPPAERPLRVAVVGAGPRSIVYTRDALQQPAAMTVVAVADPNPLRRDRLADAHGVAPERRFASYEDLAARPGLADAVINTTLDTVHYESTLALVRAGYHVLLEKPIAPSEQQVRGLIDAAREHRRIVMVCHILRYEPFYQTIKSLLDAGRVGRIISIHTIENVSYDHVATTYLRHPRNLEPAVLPMLLSKCCHDLDLIAWLAGGTALARVASVSTPTQFRPECAPEGSAPRCLDGCAIESTCRYSARALYAEDDTWDAYTWPANEYASPPSRGQKLKVLKATSPYGRCAWHCPNHVVDHQAVMIEFADGTTAAHDLFCATARAGRTIRIVGTDGEIAGDYDSGHVALRRALRAPPGRYKEEHTHVPPYDRKSPLPRSCEQDLLADFVGTVRGDPRSPGVTRIEHSLVGHQIAFAAIESARCHQVIAADDAEVVQAR